MTKIRLENISKYYGNVVAVDDVSFEVRKGEFFAILGPSGCGKTTTLRIIAGFEVPDRGRVYFDDEDVTFVKPYKRNTAMVFQNYALWPHMTVYENVAYGLKLRKKELNLTDADIDRMVKEALELVRLSGLENRYPLQLSGGQQQRVALARALVVRPRALLLDEPLSNLDAKLRIEMREELKKLQRSLNLTTIYVTHDQLEAMSLSDRIAVLNKGRLMQVGTPQELYFRPKNLFVADFLGRSNIYSGEVVAKGEGYVEVKLEDSDLIVRGVTPFENIPKKVAVIIRPEIIRLGEGGDDMDVSVRGVVDFAMFIGDKVEARLKIGKISMLIYLPNTYNIRLGDEVKLTLPWRNVVVIPSD